MTDKEFDLKLKELSLENERWHHEFMQRHDHWSFQRIIWIVMALIGIISLSATLAFGLLKIFS